MRTGAVKVLDEFGNLTPEGKELYNKGLLDPITSKIIDDSKKRKTLKTVFIVFIFFLVVFLIYWFLICKK
jgi:hypothetical protein